MHNKSKQLYAFLTPLDCSLACHLFSALKGQSPGFTSQEHWQRDLLKSFSHESCFSFSISSLSYHWFQWGLLICFSDLLSFADSWCTVNSLGKVIITWPMTANSTWLSLSLLVYSVLLFLLTLFKSSLLFPLHIILSELGLLPFHSSFLSHWDFQALPRILLWQDFAFLFCSFKCLMPPSCCHLAYSIPLGQMKLSPSCFFLVFQQGKHQAPTLCV